MRLSHVALTVPAALLAPPALTEWLGFYARVFGWREDDALSIAGRRLFLCAPTREQYLTIRAAEAPMATSGYEHVGVMLDSEAELRALHARAAAERERYADLELGEIAEGYGGRLVTFRLRLRLPLSIEVQYVRGPLPATAQGAASEGS